MANNVTIDGKDYPFGSLSEDARQQLVSMQLVDQKIVEIQQQIAIYHTARHTFAVALKASLPADELS